MRVLVTGGAGFIGSHLVEFLLENGLDVTIFDDLSTGNISNLNGILSSRKVRFIRGDLMSDDQLAAVVAESDQIYHLAAAVGVEYLLRKQVECIERCLIGSNRIFKLAAKYKKRVLFTSSSEVYGKNPACPLDENADLHIGPTQIGRWSYACAKAMDEFTALALHKEQGFEVVIARLFNVVGPRQTSRYGMVLPRFLQQAHHNEPLTVFGDGTQTRCFCYVDDVVAGLFNLMQHQKAAGQIFNLGSDEEISIDELAQRVIVLTQSVSDIKNIPANVARGDDFDEIQRRVPNLEKIEKCIGFKPRYNLNKIIQKTHAALFGEQNNAAISANGNVVRNLV